MEHLSPVPDSVFQHLPVLDAQQLGASIVTHTEMDGLPDLEGIRVAIIGVQEDRRAYRNVGCDGAADAIRPYLYQLYAGKWDFKIADLGNLYKGEKHSDTLFLLADITKDLLQKGIITIVIGGSQELTYAGYRAYDSLEQTVNVVAVDARLDVGSEGRDLDHQSYVSHMVLQEPHNLFNFTNLGYQTYFNNPDEIALIDKLFFEAVRLGQLQHHIGRTEPFVRDADLLSIDIGAIRQSYNPGTFYTSPHGFSGEELCALMRYAGMSDRLTQVGLFEYNPRLDVHGQSAHLCAHALWYFFEGISLRFGDYPVGSRTNYEKYTVLVDEDETLNFFKSPKSGRWWIEVPKGLEDDRVQLVPCDYEDYSEALSGKIPARWWKAQQKA
ncbi:MAG: hypothetical protein RL754_1130 [Bacteroidota bacterium]